MPLLRALFNSRAAALCALDDTGRITACNPQAEQLLGLPVSDLLGADLHELSHRDVDGAPCPREGCELLDLLTRGRGGDGETVLTRVDGLRLPVAWGLSPIFLDGVRTGAVVVFHDVSARHEVTRRREAALRAERTNAFRLALLADATNSLTTTLDLDEALHRLASVVVPRLATWSVVDLFTEPTTVRRAALAHTDRGVDVDRHLGVLPPLPQESHGPLARVLHGADAMLLDRNQLLRPPDSPLHAAQLELFHTLGATSAVIAPLRARGRVLGAVTIVRADPDHPYGPPEVSLVEELAKRAAMAVDNARLYEAQRDLAEMLQRAVLTDLADVAGLELATRYVPAAEVARVGGDWYDAIHVDDETTGLVIGDVVGHDVQAAARMGQLRTLLRGIAVDTGADPATVLSRVDRAVQHLEIADLATAAYLQLRGCGDGTEVTWSNAGHPPAVAVTPDRDVMLLDGDPDLVLGVGGTRHNRRTVVPAGSTLVLYTDGLVERRDVGLDVTIAGLAEWLRTHADLPLDVLCDELVAAFTSPRACDDVALLAVRL